MNPFVPMLLMPIVAWLATFVGYASCATSLCSIIVYPFHRIDHKAGGLVAPHLFSEGSIPAR